MKSIVFSPSIVPTIIQHEDTMFLHYRKLKQQYEAEFLKHNCTLVIARTWEICDCFGKCHSSKTRIKFKNGYSCNIYFGVEKNNKLICTDSIEGEEMGFSYNTAYLCRNWFHLNVILNDELEEARADLEICLQIIKGLT